MRRLTLLLLVALAGAASAQELAPASGCTLYDHQGTAVSGPYRSAQPIPEARRAAARRVVTRGNATFVVDYTSGFTTEAQAAFQRAVDIWAQHVTSSVPIRVSADFAPLDEGVLGSAGPLLLRFPSTGSVPAGIQPNTWYPFALADALARNDLFGDEPYDIVAQFSSTRDDFYFGLDGNPPQGEFDFVTIVLHELGHGLGFLGSGEVDDAADEDPSNDDPEVECAGAEGTGCWGFFDGEFSGAPFIFDRFLEDAAGVPFLDQSVYPNPSVALGDLLQSQALFVNAPTVVGLYGEPAPVWAPAPFEVGSSFSHWDENVIQGSSAALMTPRVSRGEAYLDPGDITCGFFRDMGWPLGPGCTSLVEGSGALPPPEPPVDVLTFERTGPNPFVVQTSFRIRLPEAGPLRVDVYDAVGRRVATLADGAGSTDQRFVLDGRRFAAGAYYVVVRTEAESLTRGLTVVR